MDVLPLTPELPSDIQRALQQAVGQANDAFINHRVIDQASRKKKKRHARGEDDNAGDIGSTPRKRKKVTEDAMTASVFPGVPSLAVEGSASNSKSKRSKIAAPIPGGVESLAQTDFNSQPQSTAAFISAVVAAASATAASTESPYNFSQPHFDASSPAYSFPPATTHSSLPPDATVLSTPHPFPIPVLSGLNFASSDDIVRVLQDLDVTKIASVLKTLGEAAAAANIPLASMSHTTFVRPQHIASVNPAPSNSAVIVESSARRAPSQQRRFVDMHPRQEQLGLSEHAELLATKWLSAKKLADLSKTQGLVYKKGKFSAIEEQQLSDAIQAYKLENQIDDAGFQELVFAKNGTSKHSAFWSAITAAVPMRPIIAVYHHVRRSHHPLRAQGKWMPSEDALLTAAVLELGQQWEKVSDRVGRMASDCRDRYRNHIQNSEERAVGPWTKEEEMRLTQIVTDMTVKQGRDMDNDVFWGVVSLRMGNTRGRQQCRIKWTDSLSKTVKNHGTKPRWSSQDAYILVHKVDSLRVRDDSEIDWKTLPDPHWNLWSAHTLQRRWLTMKRSIRGYEDMSHTEILDILRLKKLHLTSSRTRAVVSAEAVEDSEDGDDAEN